MTNQVSPIEGAERDVSEVVRKVRDEIMRSADILRPAELATSVEVVLEHALRALSLNRSGGVVAWKPDTVHSLQRDIMDEDEEVRHRACAEVSALYAGAVAPYAAAMAMVREAIGQLFGPIASIESEDASLLRGPEPHHEAEAQIAALQRILSATDPKTFEEAPVKGVNRKFKFGDRVEKSKGSSWHGRVCGFYSTSLTPLGYNVESEREPGSVQLYPEAALLASLNSGGTP